MTLPNNYILERKPVKHARIRVDEKQTVRVIVPVRFSDSEINLLLDQKETWINNKLDFFTNRPVIIPLDKDQLLYLGEKYRFIRNAELNKQVLIDSENKTIQSDYDLLNPIIQFNWYRMESRKVMLKRLEELAKPYKFKYNKVFIRNQKTKWGNCSGKKNLSFNWRLIKTPQFVMDYVLMHELVHTEIFKHTRQFWVKLKSVYPKYKDSIQWLDRYGNGL